MFKKLLNWRKSNKTEEVANAQNVSEETPEISEIVSETTEEVAEVDAEGDMEKKVPFEESDTLKNFHELMATATENAMRNMPMWMRLNYFANTIGNSSDDNINWEKVNKFLMLDIDKTKPYYNMCGKIKNVKQLREAAMDAKMAFVPEFNLPFYHRKCTQCGEDFSLTVGEIKYFEKKGLKVPCRCHYCRKGIERTTGNPIVPKQQKQEEEPVKTAMQIAMEKAGIC